MLKSTIGFLSLLIFTGCATFSELQQNSSSANSAVATPDLNQRMTDLQMDLRKQQLMVRDLEEENKLLREKVERVNAFNELQQDKKTKAIFQDEQSSKANLGEHELYTQVLTFYQSQQLDLLEKATLELLKKYPQSVHADNSLYLTGNLGLQTGDFEKSNKYLNRVIKKYPNSNKLVAALYAKGILFKKLNKPEQAKKVMRAVAKRYPGSPESYRAKLELRLLNKESI